MVVALVAMVVDIMRLVFAVVFVKVVIVENVVVISVICVSGGIARIVHVCGCRLLVVARWNLGSMPHMDQWEPCGPWGPWDT